MTFPSNYLHPHLFRLLIPPTKGVLFSFLYKNVTMQATKQVGKNGFLKICLVRCAQRPGATWCVRGGLLSLFVNRMHRWQWESMCPLRRTHVYNQAELYLSLFSSWPLEQLSQNSTPENGEHIQNGRWLLVFYSSEHPFVLKNLMANLHC